MPLFTISTATVAAAAPSPKARDIEQLAPLLQSALPRRGRRHNVEAFLATSMQGEEAAMAAATGGAVGSTVPYNPADPMGVNEAINPYPPVPGMAAAEAQTAAVAAGHASAMARGTAAVGPVLGPAHALGDSVATGGMAVTNAAGTAMKATGKAAGNAAVATGEAIGNAGVAAGTAVANAGVATASAVAKAAGPVMDFLSTPGGMAMMAVGGAAAYGAAKRFTPPPKPPSPALMQAVEPLVDAVEPPNYMTIALKGWLEDAAWPTLEAARVFAYAQSQAEAATSYAHAATKVLQSIEGAIADYKPACAVPMLGEPGPGIKKFVAAGLATTPGLGGLSLLLLLPCVLQAPLVVQGSPAAGEVSQATSMEARTAAQADCCSGTLRTAAEFL